jgi:uncharacterized protein YwgA
MDRQQIGLMLSMGELDLEVKVDDFDDRLILQKAVYLAQAAGVQLGYSYGWYLRGPYCPAVADDGFALVSETPDIESWHLDAQSTEKLRSLRRLITASEADRDSLAQRLELLASVHFLIDRQQVQGRSPTGIAELLQRYGKNFDEEQVKGALEELSEHALLC